MKNNLLVVLMLLVGTSALAFAQGSKSTATNSADKTTTLRGYLVDVMCGSGMADSKDAMTKAANHPRACALKFECSNAGFGVMSDGKYYKFDKAGNEKALTLLRNTKQKKGIMVEANGTETGGTFKLASLKQIKAAMESKKKG